MDNMPTPRARTRSDGTVAWQVLYRIDKKQTSETFNDARKAQRFARLIDDVGVAKAVETLAAWQDIDEEKPRTVASWAGEHVDSMTGVGEGHRKKCRAYIAHDLGALAELPLAALTPERVGAWVNAQEAAGSSGKTIKNKHGFLSAVMGHAVSAGLVPANPCAGTRLPRTVVEPMTFLTPDEYAVFLGYFTPFWQPLVATLFGTGGRFSEVTALTVGDVDLNQGTVRITKAWKDGGARIGPPKSKRSVRTLSLAPETVDVLRPLVTGRPADALVFVNQLGTRVSNQTFHENAWAPAVRLANGEAAVRPETDPKKKARRVGRRRDAAGDVIAPATSPLGKRPRIHDARHSCASWLLASGAPLNVVQAHMGHESITTTTSTYGHLMPSARSAVSTALSLALTGAHPQIEG